MSDETRGLVSGQRREDADEFQTVREELQKVKRQSLTNQKEEEGTYPNLSIPTRVSIAAPEWVDNNELTPEQQAAKKSSILDVQVIKSMKPEEVKELNSVKGAFLQATLFFVSVALGAVCPLLDSWALLDPELGKKVVHHIVQTPLIVSYIVSLILSAAIECPKRGTQALVDFVNPKALAVMLPIAGSFVFAEITSTRVQVVIDSALWRVIQQIKLPLNAALSYFIVHKSQSSTQAALLCSTFFCIVAYCLNGVSQIQIRSWTPILIGMAAITLTVVMGLFHERSMRKTPFNFNTQMAQNRLASLIVGMGLLVWECSTKELWYKFPFGGWKGRTVTLAITQLARAWVQTSVVKQLNSIWKTLAVSLSLGLTYVLSCIFLPPSLAPAFNLAQLVIILALSVNILAYARAQSDRTRLLQLAADAEKSKEV